MPLGRYFHASEIYVKKQIIYIYGGIGANSQLLNDFWMFSIQNQRWSQIKVEVEPPEADYEVSAWEKLIKEKY